MRSGLRFGLRTPLFAAVAVTIIVYFYLFDVSPWRQPLLRHATGAFIPESPLCSRLAGADDVLVVMRTGATEIQDKLPVHLRTTFMCYPDTLIFSDYAEEFRGHRVYDVLANIDERIKNEHPDFEHYNRLQTIGREGLEQSELHSESIESGPMGKNDNPGWVLDKWKFLPMVARTLELRPKKKWYLFVEPDTYIVWSNVVQWLQQLDPNQATYFGSEVKIGRDVFAHGGSAFVLSNSAINKAVDVYTSDSDEWHNRIAKHWAGDCVLGNALREAGIKLTWSWPMFQGGNPVDMVWNESKPERRLWCTPALSYHHFTSDQVERMWEYEQQSLAERFAMENANGWRERRKDTILYHSDVFRQYIMPNLSDPRINWNNGENADLPRVGDLKDVDACRRICEKDELCVQFSAGLDGCTVANEPVLGHAAPGVRSEWMMERVAAWAQRMDGSCRHRGWHLSSYETHD